MPKRILCPIDFSDCSRVALAEAQRLAKLENAKLFVVHVDIAGSGVPPCCPGYIPELDEHRRLIKEGTPDDPAIDVELHYMRGQPGDEILRFAALRDVDLIVMGTHGRSGLVRMTLGSVSEQIKNNSPCEIILTPESETSDATK